MTSNSGRQPKTQAMLGGVERGVVVAVAVCQRRQPVLGIATDEPPRPGPIPQSGLDFTGHVELDRHAADRRRQSPEDVVPFARDARRTPARMATFAPGGIGRGPLTSARRDLRYQTFAINSVTWHTAMMAPLNPSRRRARLGTIRGANVPLRSTTIAWHVQGDRPDIGHHRPGASAPLPLREFPDPRPGGLLRLRSLVGVLRHSGDATSVASAAAGPPLDVLARPARPAAGRPAGP